VEVELAVVVVGAAVVTALSVEVVVVVAGVAQPKTSSTKARTGGSRRILFMTATSSKNT
jgi:hypothetical protein